VKLNKDEIAPENHGVWEWATQDGKAVGDHVRLHCHLHSLHADQQNPYALLFVQKREKPLFLTMIPKNILRDQAWKKLEQAKARPEFAEKWNYKIPTTLGERTTFDSTDEALTAIAEAAKAHTYVAPPTMPVERTITNTKGQTLEGTIISKTDTSISLQIKASKKTVDIKLDQLSADDQAFISTLVDKKTIKPTVLFLLNQDYADTDEIRGWLTNNGFDVRIGLMTANGYGPISYKMPETVAYIKVDRLEVIDQFDIVWFHRFETYESKGKEDMSHFAFYNRRNEQKKIVVIPTREDMTQKSRFVSGEEYYRRATLASAKSERDIPFVRTSDNIIFYSSKHPVGVDAKMDEKLFRAIKAKLAK